MEKLQKGIEKAFSKGESNKWSKRLTYVIVNIILMILLFYILLNTILYNWTGSIYPQGSGFRLDFLGDNLIPFVPEMAIFYVYLFYSMVIISMVYFGIIDSEKGYALGWSLVLINLIAIIIYIVFPVSTYWWRLELWFKQYLYQGYWAQIVFGIYGTDTSFNCLPSLHAAVSTIIFYSWFRYYKLKPNLKKKTVAIITLIIASGVILSTMFIKQHYILDEITGVLLAWLVGKYIFDYLWKNF